MKTFNCNEYVVKTANVVARFHRLTIIKKTDDSTFGRFAKETVAHMESWALYQDVVRRAAYSDKPLGKTTFFRFSNENIFRNMTRETCECTQCVDEGDTTWNGIRSVLKVPCFDKMRQKYKDEVVNMQHFYEWHYRCFLEREHVQVHQCLTFALSRTGTVFSVTYTHEHVNTMSLLERDVNFLAMLRSELLKIPSGTDKDDLV